MMGALVYKLGTLTLAQGAVLTEEAEDRSTRTIYVKGSRGRILDRNGIVLAYSKTSYNVEFLRDADNRTTYDSAIYTESLLSTIEIIERNGGKVIDTSYIRRDEQGNYFYQWGVTSEAAVPSLRWSRASACSRRYRCSASASFDSHAVP
jgi:penicillin-binding protein 2